MPVNRIKRRRSKGASSSSSSSLERSREREAGGGGGGGISRGKINVSRRAIISRLAPCNFVGVLSRSLHESRRRKHGRPTQAATSFTIAGVMADATFASLPISGCKIQPTTDLNYCLFFLSFSLFSPISRLLFRLLFSFVRDMSECLER